jgi:putative inorganic carbon (hco3(-)) transporter
MTTHRFTSSSLALPLTAALGLALVIGSAASRSPLLVVLVSSTCVAGIVAIRRPESFTLLVVGLVYSNVAVVAVTVHGFPTYVAFAVPLLLAIPLAVNISQGRPVLLPPATGWLMLFTGAQLLSTIGSVDRAGSWEVVEVYVVEGLGLYIAIYNVIRSRRLLVQAMQVLVSVAAALSALSIYQWLTGTYGQDYYGLAQISDGLIKINATGTETQPRIAGPIGEKNRFAQVLTIVGPLALALVWTARNRFQRFLWVGAFVLVVVTVALTYSRGGAIGLAIMLLAALSMRKVRVRNVAVIAVIVAVVVTAVPGYRDRLASLEAIGGATSAVGEQGETDGAIRGRATQNIAALRMFADHPILGVGPGMFAVYYPKYEEAIGIRQKFGSVEAHNLQLGLASDLGIVGLVAFYGLTIALARRLWRQHRRGDALATGFLLFLIAFQATGLFLHLAYIRYFWLLMALVAAAVSLGDRDEVGHVEPKTLVTHE